MTTLARRAPLVSQRTVGEADFDFKAVGVSSMTRVENPGPVCRFLHMQAITGPYMGRQPNPRAS
jgi:hypothetical protein